MGTPYFQFSGDAQRALVDFSDEFTSSLLTAEVDEWAKDLGNYRESKSLSTVFPVGLTAAIFTELKGDLKYKPLLGKSLHLKTKEWQDGVEEYARIVEAADFYGWSSQPTIYALAAKQATNRWVANMLEANPKADFYADRDKNVASTIDFFSGSHLVNPADSSLGTFDNDMAASSIGPDMFDAAFDFFAGIKNAAGESMGLVPTDFIVPTTRGQQAKAALQNDWVVQAQRNVAGTEIVGGSSINNRFKGALNLRIASELTSSSYVYVVASRPGIFPWVVQTAGAPEEIVCDRDSQKFKDTRKISIGYVLTGNAQLAMPQAICRFTIS